MSATTTSPAPVAPVVASNDVILSLKKAIGSADSMDRLARKAAITAEAAHPFESMTAAERIKAILALYAPQLTHDAVKASFGAALVILVADKPLHVASKGSDKKAGSIVFKAPEFFTDDEEAERAKPEGGTVTELEPSEAVEKLSVQVLKKAATAARQAIGTARASGGGRKAKEKVGVRAPWFEELVGVLGDKTLRAQMFQVLTAKCRADKHFAKELALCIPEVKRAPAPTAA